MVINSRKKLYFSIMLLFTLLFIFQKPVFADESGVTEINVYEDSVTGGMNEEHTWSYANRTYSSDAFEPNTITAFYYTVNIGYGSPGSGSASGGTTWRLYDANTRTPITTSVRNEYNRWVDMPEIDNSHKKVYFVFTTSHSWSNAGGSGYTKVASTMKLQGPKNPYFTGINGVDPTGQNGSDLTAYFNILKFQKSYSSEYIRPRILYFLANLIIIYSNFHKVSNVQPITPRLCILPADLINLPCAAPSFISPY